MVLLKKYKGKCLNKIAGSNELLVVKILNLENNLIDIILIKKSNPKVFRKAINRFLDKRFVYKSYVII